MMPPQANDEILVGVYGVCSTYDILVLPYIARRYISRNQGTSARDSDSFYI